MNEDERFAEAEKWFVKAKGDLHAARIIMEDNDPVLDLICYLSQQCAEKCLKGLLIRYGIQFMYRHDLEYLLSLLPEEDRNTIEVLELGWLSTWEPGGRYPGDTPGATKDEAKQAIEIAQTVLSKITF
jgi:HEPN domain-containing protein